MTQVIIAIVMLIVSYALMPKPPVPKPAALEDFDIPTADESRQIPVVFGRVLVTGPNVVWFGDLSTTKIRGKGK